MSATSMSEKKKKAMPKKAMPKKATVEAECYKPVAQNAL